MSRRYGINGVPAIIVDGRYRTSVSLAGSQTKLIKVINFLIEKAATTKKRAVIPGVTGGRLNPTSVQCSPPALKLKTAPCRMPDGHLEVIVFSLV